jgi:outer membrane protein TolC
VTDAYSRGATPILDLLDAQSASLRADLAAATSVYKFLNDLMEVERATGSLSVLLTPEQRAAMLKRLEDYFQTNGRTGG